MFDRLININEDVSYIKFWICSECDEIKVFILRSKITQEVCRTFLSLLCNALATYFNLNTKLKSECVQCYRF